MSKLIDLGRVSEETKQTTVHPQSLDGQCVECDEQIYFVSTRTDGSPKPCEDIVTCP